MRASLSDLLQTLLNTHLSGSGWDYSWEVESHGNTFICETYYHPMNEHGFYDESFGVKFTLDFDFEVLRVSYRCPSRLRHRYVRGQQDYYESCIYNAMQIIEPIIREGIGNIV